MEPLEFVERVWSKQGKGFGFISVRPEPTQWRDNAVKWPEQRVRIPAPEEGDIYFSPNLFRRPRRRRELCLDSRWLYADLDHIDPLDLPDELAPTAAWESSIGRYQALWLLPRALPLEDHQLLNKRLTYEIGADRGGWDAPQVLRLPGTRNHKYHNDPEVVLMWFMDEPRDEAVFKRLKPIGLQSGASTAFPPSPLTARQILRKYDGKIPAGVRGKLRSHSASGDRSKVLFRLEMTLLARGVPPGEVYVLLKDSVWNKFDSADQLLADIGRAHARVR